MTFHFLSHISRLELGSLTPDTNFRDLWSVKILKCRPRTYSLNCFLTHTVAAISGLTCRIKETTSKCCTYFCLAQYATLQSTNITTAISRNFSTSNPNYPLSHINSSHALLTFTSATTDSSLSASRISTGRSQLTAECSRGLADLKYTKFALGHVGYKWRPFHSNVLSYKQLSVAACYYRKLPSFRSVTTIFTIHEKSLLHYFSFQH